ncbi:MAG: TetR/AcrR family transcriptional regulator [Chitinophagaceae bacterium]|nr:MAG: TetR/AcrR family transcriptional regulator [Chitinophagaceae bacterium]
MEKDSREHILEVSLSLFLQKGFKGVTMRDIVEKTGLSKGAFYHYFKSKEQVFEEVANYFYKDIFIQHFEHFSHESLKAFCEDCLKDVDEKFLTVRKIGGNRTEEWNINHYFLIFDAVALLPSFKKLHTEHHALELKSWKKIIGIAKKSGEIKSALSNEQIAKMFLYMGDGFGMNVVFDGSAGKMEAHKKEIRQLWGNFYEMLKGQ